MPNVGGPQMPSLAKALGAAQWRRAQWCCKVDRWLEVSLDAPLNQHCRTAGLEGNTLVLLADDATWLAWLRGALTLETVRHAPGCAGVRSVVWRLAPEGWGTLSAEDAASQPSHHLPPSPDVSRGLQALAQSVPSHALASALSGLAETLQGVQSDDVEVLDA